MNRMLKFLNSILPAFLAFSCSFDFNNVPEGAQITCRSTADCPNGWVCNTTIGFCVKSIDPTPPSFETTPELTPGYLKSGATATLKFRATKDLLKTPEVNLSRGNSNFSFAVDVSKSGGRDYVFTYTATGKETEFADYAVLVTMTDKSGNTAEGKNAGKLQFQFHAPVIDQTSLLLNGSPVKNGGTVKVSFTLNRSVSTEPVVTIDGGRTFTKESSSGGVSFVYSYTASTEDTGDGTLIEKGLTIEAGDEAGNLLTKTLDDKITFDFKKPVLAGDIINAPEHVALLGAVTVAFETDEEMGPDPDVSLDKIAMSRTAREGKKFVYTHITEVADGSGTKPISIKLVDLAGNESVTDTGKSVEFIFSKPEISNPVITITDGRPKARAQDTVTIQFTVDRELAETPKVKLGLNPPLACTAVIKTYTCAHLVQAEEGDGEKEIRADLVDLAGNSNSVPIGSVIYDVTPPALVNATILRNPIYAPYNPQGAAGFFFSVKDPVTNGAVTATLYAYANENLGASKSLTVTGPAPLDFKPDPTATGNAAVFTCSINETDPEGTYKFKVTWQDTMGNQAVTDVPVNLVLDKTPPPAEAVDTGKVTLKRVPWGRLDPSDHSTWMPAHLAVVGDKGAVDISVVSGIYFYKGSSADPGRQPDTGPGNLLGTTAPDKTDGSFDIQQLGSSDQPVVHLALVKNHSGVKGSTHLIKNIEWTASLGEKVSGSTYENPNLLYTCGRLLPYLIPGDQTCFEPLQADIDKFNRTDPEALTREAEASWLNYQLNGTSPGARWGHAMAYDSARGKVVLFGGYVGTSYNNETWEWDGETYSWAQRTPGGSSPGGRRYHAMAYDAARGRVVMFGGEPTNDETWEWDGAANTWTRRTPDGTGPSARYGHAMAYDSARGKIVLFGGEDLMAANDETWEWDGAANTWTKRSPSDTSPEPRQYHAMAYDGVRGKVVLFGGLTPAAIKSDTWEWDGAANAWIKRSPSGGTSPAARTRHAMSFDSAKGKITLFGGKLASGNSNETWEWDGAANTWVKKTPTGAVPSVRNDLAMAFDAARGKTVIFGGQSGSSNKETWEWDGTLNSWIQRTPSATTPGGRRGHAMVYDGDYGRVLLFGGYTGTSNSNELWEWDGALKTWTQRTPSGTSPDPRFDHSMAYDGDTGRVLLFGGFVSGSFNNETWKWETAANAWTKQAPAAGPTPRAGAAMVFDAAAGRPLLFGGMGMKSGVQQRFNDTWSWQWQPESWTQENPGTELPSPRSYPAMAFDGSRNKAELFGGYTDDWLNKYSNETWEWDYATGKWMKKTPTGQSPAARSGHAMVYDEARRKSVIFGGFAGASPGYYNDAWEWDSGANAWTQRTPRGRNPSAREGHAMAYDGDRGRVVLFGGYTGLSHSNETWEFDGGSTNTSAQIFQASLYSALLKTNQRIQSIQVNFQAGGIGYPGGTVTNGARIKPWIDYQWVPVEDASARNTSDQNNPGSLTWSTTDPVTIQRMSFGPQKYVSFAVTPVAVNGTGIGQIALKDVRVTVNYKLCVDEGDCP